MKAREGGRRLREEAVKRWRRRISLREKDGEGVLYSVDIVCISAT